MTKNQVTDPIFPECPVRNIIARIGDKWSVLVLRHAYAEVPPRVEYELTERARSLLPHIHNLVGWALDNLSNIIKDRKAFIENGHR